MKFLVMSALIIAPMLGGCGYKVGAYAPAAKNQMALRKLGATPVAIKEFSAGEFQPNDLLCRHSAPIRVPETYTAYVEQAFAQELKFSGLLDPSSQNIVSGKLAHFDLTTFPETKWLFTLTLTNHTSGKTATTSSTFPFEFALNGVETCTRAAFVFSDAVQKLMFDTFNNPEFKSVVSN